MNDTCIFPWNVSSTDGYMSTNIKNLLAYHEVYMNVCPAATHP